VILDPVRKSPWKIESHEGLKIERTRIDESSIKPGDKGEDFYHPSPPA
jgi:hypothetical protein